MNYISERSGGDPVSFIDAVLTGLAPDGGLYVPTKLPWHLVPYEMEYDQFIAQLLMPFVPSDLPLADWCERAFSFPVSIRPFGDHHGILELFHGPSLSFKDFGARFLAQVMQHCPTEKPRLIMVATSGDTGSAVAAAFHQQPNVQVVILYPKGKVSARQAHQLSCWGDNITTLAVEGTFDDCQALVKQAFTAPDIQARFHLTTANSINIGRLLPQMGYYAYSSLQRYADTQQPINVIVPSGNLGNVTAAFWARALGYPIGNIVIAQNANASMVRYLDQGVYQPKASVETLANAMDVGAPSNFARLQKLYPTFTDFSQKVQAFDVSDVQIQQAIVSAYKTHGLRLCPHTATAYHVWQHDVDNTQPWLIAATADPAKFESIVEPLLGIELPLSETFQAQLARPAVAQTVAADLDAIIRAAMPNAETG